VKTLGAGFCALGLWFATAGLSLAQPSVPAATGKSTWRGVHLICPGRNELPLLKKTIDEGLKPLGVNVVVLEINYGYQFQSRKTQGGIMTLATKAVTPSRGPLPSWIRLERTGTLFTGFSLCGLPGLRGVCDLPEELQMSIKI